MTTASYDRSGRMIYESFAITPSYGFSDPLASYFNGFLTSMGGMFTVAPSR